MRALIGDLQIVIAFLNTYILYILCKLKIKYLKISNFCFSYIIHKLFVFYFILKASYITYLYCIYSPNSNTFL